jgi:hypothetical protein
LLSKIGKFIGLIKAQPVVPNESDSRIPGAELQKHDQIKALERLEQLRDKGILTEQEFELQKNSILKENIH